MSWGGYLGWEPRKSSRFVGCGLVRPGCQIPDIHNGTARCSRDMCYVGLRWLARHRGTYSGRGNQRPSPTKDLTKRGFDMAPPEPLRFLLMPIRLCSPHPGTKVFHSFGASLRPRNKLTIQTQALPFPPSRQTAVDTKSVDSPRDTSRSAAPSRSLEVFRSSPYPHVFFVVKLSSMGLPVNLEDW